MSSRVRPSTPTRTGRPNRGRDVRKMSENSEANRTRSDEAQSDPGPTANDNLSSLDRLAEFTRRILRVSKDELREDHPSPPARAN
jgi:hypothetical protein